MSESAGVLQRSERPARFVPEPVMRSPAHRLHAALGARFRQLAGWEIPAAYGPLEAERAIIREGLAIADVTPRGKVDVRGPVDEVLARFVPGADVQIARLSARWALLLTPAGAGDRCLMAAEQALGSSGMATDVTSAYAGIVMFGRQALELIARLTPTDASLIAEGRAAGLQLARIPAVLVRSERAIELYAGSEYGRYLWQTVVDTAARLEGRPVGWDALIAEGWR